MATPFPELLAQTIAQQHVTLDQLARQLRSMGTPVSIATLSYWQSGRSAPTRPRSLRALANLESLLEVPPGHLTGVLPGVEDSVLWGTGLREDGLRTALAEMGLAMDQGYVKLVLHEVLHLDERPGEHRRHTRQLMRAVSQDVLRLPLVTVDDPDGGGTPEVEALYGCHVGRSLSLQEYGVSVVELVLDEVLRQGHEMQLEYQTRWPHDQPPTGFNRQVRIPVHYLVMEARCREHTLGDVRYTHQLFEHLDQTPVASTRLADGPNPVLVTRNAGAGTHTLGWSVR